MKIKITLLALLVAIGSSSYGQQYAEDYVIDRGVNASKNQLATIFGVVAGVTTPRLTDKMGNLDIRNSAGGQVGMIYGVDLGGLQFTSEILFQHDKSTIINLVNGTHGELVNNGLEFPIVVGMGVGPININVGPTFSLMSNSRFRYTDSEGGVEEIDFGRTKSTAGYLFGLSTTLWEHFILDARYTGRFVSTKTNWYEGSEDSGHYEYRFYSFAFSVGYRF